MEPKFRIGDKVFAKVRGYPYWPARVEGFVDTTDKKQRYHIYFYGTGETAVVKTANICSFVENIDKYGKPKKHKNFKDALIETQAELTPEELEATTKYLSVENKEGVSDDEYHSNASRRSSTSRKSEKMSAKKEKKRKITNENAGPDDIEQKKARISGTPNSSEEQTSPRTSLKSSFGRAIKPKKFPDSTVEDAANTVKSSKVNHKESTIPSELDETEKLQKITQEEMNNEDSIFVEVDGEKVEIPLKLNRPAFISSKSAHVWDDMVRKYALELKQEIENGEPQTETIQKRMEKWTKQKLSAYETEKENQGAKLFHLRTETILLDLDTRIKSSLSLYKADAEKCLNLLDQLLQLDITSLMLKKHPEIVETIKKMRNYVGNTANWKMTSEEISEFHKQAAAIRTKSETVYSKFKNLFLVPNEKCFWDVFAKELEIFNKKTENMTMDNVLSLVKEPE